MKRFMRVLLIIFVIGAGAASWYFYDLYKNVEETANAIYEPLTSVSAAQTPPAFRPQPSMQATDVPAQKDQKTEDQQASKAISILLFGVDKRGTDAGRSDTIIYLVSNPSLKQTLMFSIPRDTRT